MDSSGVFTAVFTAVLSEAKNWGENNLIPLKKFAVPDGCSFVVQHWNKERSLECNQLPIYSFKPCLVRCLSVPRIKETYSAMSLYWHRAISDHMMRHSMNV